MNYRIQTIVDEIPAGSKVLDIGAAKVERESENFSHHHIADRAGECIGIDINQDAIDQLDDYDIRYANAANFDLGETFDVVVAGEVIEHFSMPGQMLACVNRHLEVGGRFILSTPYPWTFVRFREALRQNPHAFEEHVCWYCPRTIRVLLGQYGFDTERVHFTRAKQLGISRLFAKLGFERLGAPGFVNVATKSDDAPAFDPEKTFYCNECDTWFDHSGVPERCPDCGKRDEARWSMGYPNGRVVG